MTLSLKINQTNYDAKASFAFLKVAESFGNFDEKVNKFVGGLENLVTSLVTSEIESLVQFWTAATAHYGKKDKPSEEQIQTALEEQIEGGKDLDVLFKEAYNFMRNSGFFKKKIQNYWEQTEMMKDFGATEDEKKTNKIAYEQLMKMKNEIEA